MLASIGRHMISNQAGIMRIPSEWLWYRRVRSARRVEVLREPVVSAPHTLGEEESMGEREGKGHGDDVGLGYDDGLSIWSEVENRSAHSEWIDEEIEASSANIPAVT